VCFEFSFCFIQPEQHVLVHLKLFNHFISIQVEIWSQKYHSSDFQQEVHNCLVPRISYDVRICLVCVKSLVCAVLEALVVDVADRQLLVVQFLLADPLDEIEHEAAQTDEEHDNVCFAAVVAFREPSDAVSIVARICIEIFVLLEYVVPENS